MFNVGDIVYDDLTGSISIVERTMQLGDTSYIVLEDKDVDEGQRLSCHLELVLNSRDEGD